MKDERFKKAEFAAWIGIIGNIVLAIGKGLIGFTANSKALVADAVHSASDVIGSLAVLIGLRAAQKPPDEDHPYGHGKAETIAAMIVGMILFLVGFEVAISSARGLFEPLGAPAMIAIFAAFVSMVVKEAMFQYKYRLGKKLNSQALIANAWEHRSDVYSSLAAVIGIGGAVIGGMYDIPVLLYLDPIGGIVVSLLVLKMAYDIMKESIHNSLDHVMRPEDAQHLVDAVEKVEGVIVVNQLLAREHGHYVIVDVKVAVNPIISVEEGHTISKRVKKVLMDNFDHVRDVMVHINPYQSDFDDHHPSGIRH